MKENLKDKYDRAVWECYELMFTASTPSADFNDLVAKADVDDNGRKVIDFMSYEIAEDQALRIINDVCRKYKIPKFRMDAVRASVLLGCSPKFKKDDRETFESGCDSEDNKAGKR